MTESMREQFEAWADPDGKYANAFKRDAHGEYIVMTTRLHWMGWQAALRSPAVAGLVEAINQYRDDYRSEGCPLPDCHVCARSKAAESRLDAALAQYATLAGEKA